MRLIRRTKFLVLFMIVAVMLPALPASAQESTEPKNPPELEAFIDQFIEREVELQKGLREFKPRIEVYIQDLKPDPELGWAPKSDKYFIGRLDLREGIRFRSFVAEAGLPSRALAAVKQFFTMDYVPGGFAYRIVPDDDFNRDHYRFEYVRREFLGDVRTVVFNVMPKPKSGSGRFYGRIWVEDQDHNIVRFNGMHAPHNFKGKYSHFDSWRVQMGPGLWLPAYVYVEEPTDRFFIGKTPPFKGQIRLWAYNLKKAGRQNEFTTLVVESPAPVREVGEAAPANTPVEMLRAWERQAEDNVLDRLEKAGLTAPESEVDKVLKTVVTNLEVTNNLNIQPEVRCRVLLTTPLESFTVGRTIVLSRGLIDTLPDEASLAMVLAHELGHIALGHRLDTKWAFHDRMLFGDEETFNRFGFGRDENEEQAADKKAMEMLMNSPYKDKLPTAGLYLRTVGARADELRSLIRPHLGNRLARNREVIRMLDVMRNAPQLEIRNVEQVSALPLGGRIALDPWDNRIELVKAKPVPLVSAREKIPLEVTPVVLHLTRQGAPKQVSEQTNGTLASQPVSTDQSKQ